MLYALLFLHEDMCDSLNYVAAARYVLLAEQLATQSGNRHLLAVVQQKRAWLDFIVHDNAKSTINKLERAAWLCADAGDTLCAAECLEKIAVLYARQGDYSTSHHYFNLALPVLSSYRFADKAAAYNNFATLLDFEDRQLEEIAFLDSAILIDRETGNLRREMISQANKALAEVLLGNHERGLALFQYCKNIDSTHGWLDNLQVDYYGLAFVSEKLQQFPEAFRYLALYNKLRDSTHGPEVQLNVARENARADSQILYARLENSAANLQASKSILRTQAAVILIAFCIVALLTYLFVAKRRNSKQQQQRYLRRT